MKKLLALFTGTVALISLLGVAHADAPTKQEGRVWIDTNLLLVFSPKWSLTTMPGARAEFARSREGSAGMQFLELFFGPNYTHKMGNLTLKGSLWYYYMGYPQRGRLREATDGTLGCPPTTAPNYCPQGYNASHNIEIIPAAEYRMGRWSIYDRVIFHNTFYADMYSTPQPDISQGVSDLRWGWGTVLRELLQVRFAVTDRLGVSLADEVFFGIIEDGDTSKIKDNKGYDPRGYWKSGFRYNRTYLGFDYKVAPNFTIAPMYMVEIGVSPVDSGDVTDIAHTLFMVATISANVFADGK
jgi:hypothetical protein